MSTRAKLRSFLEYPEGWSFGEGRPARICEPAVIALRAALAKAEAEIEALQSRLAASYHSAEVRYGERVIADAALARAEAEIEKRGTENAELRRKLFDAETRAEKLGADHALACDTLAAWKARAEKAEAERDALERAIGEWIDVRARIGVPATFADKNLRDALHSLRASRRAPNHHPARPEADRG